LRRMGRPALSSRDRAATLVCADEGDTRHRVRRPVHMDALIRMKPLNLGRRVLGGKPDTTLASDYPRAVPFHWPCSSLTEATLCFRG
jgi:hypothetical protein